MVSEGFGHDQTVGTLSKLRTGTVTRLVMGRELGLRFEQLETNLTLDGVTGYISNVFRVIVLPLANILLLRAALFVDCVAVLLEQINRGKRHPAVSTMQTWTEQTKGRGSRSSPVRELDVQIFMNVPHVRFPVLLSFELAIRAECAGEPLSGVDSVHVFVPAFLLHEFLAQITKLTLLLIIKLVMQRTLQKVGRELELRA